MPHTKGTAGENKTNEGASCEFLGSHGAGPSRMHPWRDRAKPLIKGRLPLLFGVCIIFIERRKRPYHTEGQTDGSLWQILEEEPSYHGYFPHHHTTTNTMTSSRESIRSFLAGAVCSAALHFIYQKVSYTRARRIESRLNTNEATNRPLEIRMDSCSLDQRMIRKAEGAIRNRTSRLIVVVERCTNDHNYSAILRTVEALGVQHVYIIAPQCIQTTLTTDNEGDNEVEDIKASELKRSSGQLIKRATESEIRDRAMHHLYARKATEWLTVTGKRMRFITFLCIDVRR